MYTREEREGVLWEFHRSGMSVSRACETLPLFPSRNVLAQWLRLEAAGGLAAREMPDRRHRMHCAHGEGSPGWRIRAGRIGARVGQSGETQTSAITGPTSPSATRRPPRGTLRA